jgi:hypothetical protein
MKAQDTKSAIHTLLAQTWRKSSNCSKTLNGFYHPKVATYKKGLPMYKVTFEDGTEFDGGEPDISLWDQLPNKPIKSILYWVNNRKFIFSDFEEYNHCVERVFGVTTNMQAISRAIIMGRVKKRVYQVIFDFRNKDFVVTRDVKPYGQEYNDKPLTGWKFGILLEEDAFPGPKLKEVNDGVL